MTFSKLGTDTDTGQIVELPQASRRQGLYIIGANGTGKSGLIEHLILQDIDQGLGVGLLDPHGDLTHAILAKMTKREDDVILLDILDEDHPFGLNLFECPNPQSNTAVQKIVDLVMHIFEKLYDVSRQTPRMAQFLRNCTHTLVANPGYTMADIPLLLQDGECRKKLVANVTDPKVRLFWQTYEALKPSEQFDRAESTLNKMDELLQPLTCNIVGQAQTTVNIQQVMDERKILLVKLSAQLDQVTSLVGTMFIALFLNAAYSRASIPINKRKQFNLYADEFQRFATEDFATLLTEARKFGIATTIAHQARYQPGMTDGIRAVSLQAANQVVFRVTSPDADELAGGFDITPQAAWEEEIEKEWVEILKPEWYERVEEEVLDGTEPIMTPVTDVVGHLLKNGHANPVVNRFATRTLKRLHTVRSQWGRQAETQLPQLNLLLYEAMVYQRFDVQLPIETLIIFLNILQNGIVADSYTNITPYPFLHGDHYTPRDYNAMLQGISVLWTEQPGSVAWQEWMAYFDQTVDQTVRTCIREKNLGYLSKHLGEINRLWGETGWEVDEEKEATYRRLNIPTWPWPMKLANRSEQERLAMVKEGYRTSWERRIRPEQTWYSIDPEKDIEKYVRLLQTIPQGIDREQESKMWQGLFKYFYNPAELDRVVDAELQEQKTIFLNFITELKDVMHILATQDGQIKAPSGLQQPRKRKQINYHTHPPQTLTHPRKVIMHPQRTYQDVRNDIANQLSGLPNFTARVKTNENASQNPVPQNPGKKCLKCKLLNSYGAKFCRGCGKQLPVLNEYTLTTLKPLGGLGKAAVQQRLTTIQGINRQKGYVRDRSAVEAEIIKRQNSCSSGVAPAQPQLPQPAPQQQARHARQVPVQGKCPNCGFSHNPSGAKFCSNCGKKL